MPSYLGNEINIRLSSSDLVKTITENPHGVKVAANARLQEIASAFTETGHDLQELVVPADGSSLRFIGENQDIPFFLMKASKDIPANSIHSNLSGQKDSSLILHLHQLQGNPTQPITQPARLSTSSMESNDKHTGETLYNARAAPSYAHMITNNEHRQDLAFSAKRFPASIIYDEISGSHLRETRWNSYEIKPQALGITIDLGAKSFLPRPRYAATSQGNPMVLDVKIDIFLNGELCTSSFVSERYRNSATQGAKLTQRYSGKRIDRLFEKPWILVPSGQNFDGTLTHSKRAKRGSTASQQRLAAINNLLRAEAEDLGRDSCGSLTLLGEYLVNLSGIEMPEGLLTAGKAKYGIIDVILTSGQGKKDNPSCGYLLQPASIRLSDLRWKLPEPSSENLKIPDGQSLTVMRKPKLLVNAHIVSKTQSELPTAKDHEQSHAPPARKSDMLNGNSNPSPTASVTALFEHGQSAQPRKRLTSLSLEDLEWQGQKRRRGNTMLTCRTEFELETRVASGGPGVLNAEAEERTVAKESSLRDHSTISDDCVVSYAPNARRQIRSERSGWFKESSVLVGVRYILL